MTEENETESTIADVSGYEVAEKAINTIGGALLGVPASIQKNAFKAFAQLCSTAIDIPIAHLEGIAAEKRAETRSRIKIINTGAEQIAQQMHVNPEFAHVAVKKFSQKIVREQVNLNIISENAARELALKPHGDANNETKASVEEEISEDWLNIFEKEACNKSSEDMRLLFGKILAGEIHKPSSYSMKTIKLISQLDNQAAKLFQLFCSLCVSLQLGDIFFDARVLSLGGNAGLNALQKYGLHYSDLNVLHEYGLITPDYDSYMGYQTCISDTNNQFPSAFKYQGKSFGLLPQDERDQNANLRLNGVALSKSGKELLNIIDILSDENYTADLIEYFQNQKLQMVEVNAST